MKGIDKLFISVFFAMTIIILSVYQTINEIQLAEIKGQLKAIQGQLNTIQLQTDTEKWKECMIKEITKNIKLIEKKEKKVE